MLKELISVTLPKTYLDGADPEAELTTAERRVLLAMVKFDTAPEAAKEIGCLPQTVHYHLRHVYEKLGVHSLHRAILVAHHRGLLAQ